MQDVSVRDRAAYLGDADALVLADVHVGRDESSGVEFPLGERTDLLERLDGLLAHFSPETVVFAGDVFHSFGRASSAARAGLAELLDACRDADAGPVLVAGNHDGALTAVCEEPVCDSVVLDDGTVVCHGHEEPEDSGPRYVVGHDHPTLSVEGVRRPCFLYGPGAYRGGDLLMLPAFNRLAAGVEVNAMRAADFQSPLVSDPDALCPIVYDPDSMETFRFPPLGEFRRML